MRLHDYLKEKNLTPGEFATLIGGVSESGVRKWLRGERIPRGAAMRKILEVTRGVITAGDFFGATDEDARIHGAAR